MAKSKLLRPGNLILLAGLIGLGFGGLGWKQQFAKAQNAEVATGVNWPGASFPVEGFQEYTSPFGYRSSGFHYGLDLAAPQGSYIRSWWQGTVTEVWQDDRCGTGIAIQSGQWEHIYCHIQGSVEKNAQGTYFIDRQGGIQLWEGQQVPSGTRIARVGMSGRTTGPHLHWGLKHNGNWVDPGRVLRSMYNQQVQQANRG